MISFEPGLIELFLGVFVLTFSAWLVVWYRIRVILLREQMFAIRDELWDAAYRLGCLEDPAYQLARKRLNDCILVANAVNVSTMALAESQLVDRNPAPAPVSAVPEMQAAIDRAYDQCVSRLMSYIFYHTFSGWLICFQSGVRFVFDGFVSHWVRSDAPERLRRMDAEARQHRSTKTPALQSQP